MRTKTHDRASTIQQRPIEGTLYGIERLVEIERSVGSSTLQNGED